MVLPDGDGHEGVAAGAGTGPQAAVLRTEQQGQGMIAFRASDPGRNRVPGSGIESEAGEVRFAQAGQGPREPAYPDHRDGFECAGGGLGQGSGLSGSMPVRQDEECGSEGRSRAQDRADVPGVRDPIETDRDRLGPGGPAQACEIGSRERVDLERDPLMGSAGSDPPLDLVPSRALRNQRGFAPAQEAGKRLRKAGPGFAGDEHPVDGAGGILQGRPHRVPTVQPQGGWLGAGGSLAGIRPVPVAPGWPGCGVRQAAANCTPSAASRARLIEVPHA